MARSDIDKAAKARNDALQGALTQIEREFGKGTVMRMGDEGAQVKVNAIPTGALSLDLALGIGGMPRGRIVEVFGPESSGKTTLVYHVLAEAQKLGGVCAFIDAEHAMDPLYARSASTSTSCSSRSPTTASRRWRSRTCSSARAPSTSSPSTPSRR
jgi:recombination protein RecA